MLKSKLKGKSMWYYIKSVMNIVLGLTLVVFLPLIVMLVADCSEFILDTIARINVTTYHFIRGLFKIN